MAKLWITELNNLGSDATGARPPIAAHPAVAAQTPITITSSSAQSAATSAGSTYVRLCADVACHYTVGANPTATANNSRLPADTVEYIGVPAGLKIAVILPA